MGTEQKKDAGVVGLWIEAARVAEAADSQPLSSCSSHSSCISMAWRLSPPTGACRQAVRRDNHLPQQLLTYAWQCCISTKPCALSRLTLR